MSDASSSARWTTPVALLALGAIAALLVWVLRAPSVGDERDHGATAERGDGLAFPAIAYDEILAAWADERASLEPVDDRTRALLFALSEANTAQALATLELLDGDPALASTAFEAELDAYATERGAEGVRAAGWHAFAAFEEALRELLVYARAQERSVRDVLRSPTDPVAQKAYQGCGDFVVWALRQGLIDDDGAVDATPTELALLFHFRWARLASGGVPVESTLPGAEYRAVMRWRIQHADVPLEDRLRYIESYARMFGFEAYPESFARGMAHVIADDPASARPLFEAAAAEAADDGYVQRALAALPPAAANAE